MQARWFSARQLVLAAVVGLVIGVGTFWLTSMQPQFFYTRSCHPGVAQGFDPWRGSPHGATLLCEPSNLIGAPLAEPSIALSTMSTIEEPTPDDLVGRRAIPVPLGFLVGAGCFLILTSTRRHQRPMA